MRAQGCDITYLNRDALYDLPVRTEFDLIHLNWPQSLPNPQAIKRRKYLPRFWYRKWFLAEIDRLATNLLRTKTPVVWQIHDLPHGEDSYKRELIKHLFDKFYLAASGLIFYEESAQMPFFELYRPRENRIVGVAHLGDYGEIHGPSIDKELARAKLEITREGKVFLYPGTIRYSRNPALFIQTFLRISSPNDLLIVTGRGTHKTILAEPNERVKFLPGMVSHEKFRDLICSSDFVVNDAFQYLGSAIIRVALGYGVPVIASSFGCTSDIAKGAYIPIEETKGGLDSALETALALPKSGYDQMVQNALERHKERPWSAYARGCLDVYQKTIGAGQ